MMSIRATLKLILLISIFTMTLSLRYEPDDPADKTLVDQNKPLNASGDTGARDGHVFVVKPNGTNFLQWEEVACNKTVLKQYLELDATVVGNSTFINEASHGHGPCCLNQHHYVCQIMIREINRCQSMKSTDSKFGASEPTSCPT